MADRGFERTWLEILDAGYDVARVHFRALFGLAFVAHLPLALFQWTAESIAIGVSLADGTALLLAGSLVVLAMLAIALLAYGALTHAICTAIGGGAPDWRVSLQATRAVAGRLLWTFLVATLAVAIGTICLILPGLYLGLIVNLLLLPVCLVEGIFGGAALARTHRLVRGSGGRALVVVLVVAVATAVLNGFAQFAVPAGPAARLPALLLAGALAALLQVSVFSVFFFSARAHRQVRDAPRAASG